MLGSRREARRDALQGLYMAARSFIVDERQLEARVDELFADDYWSNRAAGTGPVGADNAWDVYGEPPTAQRMLAEVSRSQRSLIDFSKSESDRTLRRQKIVSEELTGGTMD